MLSENLNKNTASSSPISGLLSTQALDTVPGAQLEDDNDGGTWDSANNIRFVGFSPDLVHLEIA